MASELANLEDKLDEIGFGEREAKDTLICFHQSPLAGIFNGLLVRRFQESGLDNQRSQLVVERISRQTHRYLKEAAIEVRDKIPALAALYGEGWQRDREAYTSIDRYLSEVIASKPKEQVFDEEFTFKDIFVPLAVKPVVKTGDRVGEVDKDAEEQNMLG